jgi:hypothetical protein
MQLEQSGSVSLTVTSVIQSDPFYGIPASITPLFAQPLVNPFARPPAPIPVPPP